MKISKKQKKTLQLLNNPQIVDLLFGGGAGGGKSITVCVWAVLQCRDYPGIRIGLGRKELTNLKKTTLVTLLQEVHPMLGVNSTEFKYSEMNGLITYINGSAIQLVDLAPSPSDPNFDRFGSMLFTHTIIEEGGEIAERARDAFFSRKNRWKNKEYSVVGKSITTCNPSQSYLKRQYYKPYQELGGGDFQIWSYGQAYINDAHIEAFRAFVPSLATDNPFIDKNYVETLRKLPMPERKRLLEGSWDYDESDALIFKSSTIDRALTRELTHGERFIGVDVADVGSDNTIMSLVEGDILVDQQEIIVDKDKPVGEQIAKAIIQYATTNGIDILNAEKVAIDVIGVGASTRDFLRQYNWYVTEFLAGAASEGNYKNLRSEAIYEMGIAMADGTFKIYENLPDLDKLRDEMLPHEYYTEERRIVVKSKEEVKKALGHSPDRLESAYIARWVAQKPDDPRHDASRIVYGKSN